MNTKNSKQWTVLVAVVGLVAGFQGAAHADQTSDWLQSLFSDKPSNNNNQGNAPDQRQVQADQALATQYQQAYQSHQTALTQAYEKLRQDQRSGVDTTVDRKNVKDLNEALRVDVGRQQANSQDLAKAGVAYPYTIASAPAQTAYQQSDRGHWQDDRWKNNNDRRDDRRSWDRHDHTNYRYDHKRIVS